MRKHTKLGVNWFYNIVERGESEFVDFKEQLGDKELFGKCNQSFSGSYRELAKDIVAFANYKGGFIFFGIVDKDHSINKEFKMNDTKKFELIRNIQDLTRPSITIVPHELKIDNTKLLLLEIPFSDELHCTSKGEYLVRNFNGNKILQPHELITVLAEKKQLIFDQKIWKIDLLPSDKDNNHDPVPGWQNLEKTRNLYGRIQRTRPNSPYLKSNMIEFAETLGLIKEVQQESYPTTTGLLFIGTEKSLKELPFGFIKYIRYKADGSYTPFEFKGNLLSIADECFNQLKSEISLTEFQFGLFREFVEDYSEIVLRELLINALGHRDYSRRAHIEIRKYENYIEFESPGEFPDGVTSKNYLRKSNARNPFIMDIFRETKYAEKAGSGFDKIFTELLSKGKSLLEIEEQNGNLIFRVYAETYSKQLIKLSYDYKELKGKDMDLEKLLVLESISLKEKASFKDLLDNPHIRKPQLKKILKELEEIEFVETSGRTSSLKYIIHKSRLITSKEERNYLINKKQSKQKEIEVILRYLNEFDEIDNSKARELLLLPNNKISYVSRLFKKMKENELIKIKRRGKQKTYYCKK